MRGKRRAQRRDRLPCVGEICASLSSLGALSSAVVYAINIPWSQWKSGREIMCSFHGGTGVTVGVFFKIKAVTPGAFLDVVWCFGDQTTRNPDLVLAYSALKEYPAISGN